jgi:hypothetical protein
LYWTGNVSILSHLFDVHALDEIVPNEISMVNDRVKEKPAGEIADCLVNLDDKTTLCVALDVKRFDVRINGRPLTGPVGTHRVNSFQVPTLHAIRPFHFRMEVRKKAIETPGVEVPVGVEQEVSFIQ